MTGAHIAGLDGTYWPYAFTLVLMAVGLYGMLLKDNYVKKLIGMNIFQGAIILFFIALGYKTGGTVPIWDPALGNDPTGYMNPLPHGLMLTAIVVSVATTGVALALLIRIYARYGTLDESALLERLRRDD
jgi:multicomponent Na+:H+ antiporter subunit C